MGAVAGRKRSERRHAGVSGERERPVDGQEGRQVKDPSAWPGSSEAEAAAPALDFAQVGEQVASVLAAAREAAEKMKLEAIAETQRFRTAMEQQTRGALEKAKATKEEADAHAARVKADAERQSKELRTQADEYASRRRQAAEAEAAEVLARAQKQASVRERSVEERRRALDESVARTEERLRQLIAGLNNLASGLAELLPAQGRDEGRSSESPAEVLAAAARSSHTEAAEGGAS
jgi:hypothetical protein